MMKIDPDGWEELTVAFDGVTSLHANETADLIYTRYIPPPHRMRAKDLPDHKLGWVKVKDASNGHVRYKARCTCGEKQTDWTSKRGIESWHGKHIAKLTRQKLFL